jgi:hypothetical protein
MSAGVPGGPAGPWGSDADVSADGRYVRVRRRSRRSSRRRSRERYRRLLVRGLIALGAAAVMAVPAGVVARDLVVVRRALIGTEAELRDAAAALAAGDLVRTAGAVRSADLIVDDIVGRVDRPVWRAASALPRVGEPLALARALVLAASTGTDLARLAVDEDLGFLLRGFEPRAADGRIDLVPLLDVAARLERLDTGPTRAALDELAALGRGLDNEALLTARRSTLELGTRAVDAIDRARTLSTVLPGLLGDGGSRTYAVVLQTSAELRGTGGLYGQWTLLEVDRGRLELGPMRDLPDGVGDPVAVSGAFADRYGRVAADRTLANVNLDPDLATSGRVTLDLLAARTGERADGLILLDPYGLQALLEAVDVTLTLPSELIDGTAAPATLGAARFARFTTVDVYDAFGAERATEREALQLALGEQALLAVVTRPWDGPRVADAVLRAVRGRHLQVLTADPSERAVLASTPAGGDLAGALARTDADVLAVTHNNAVGGKQDVHLAHRLAVGIELAAPDAAAVRAARTARGGPGAGGGAGGATVTVQRRAVLEAGIANSLAPGAFDIYVTGNCLVGGATRRCFEGPEAENRTWLTFWLDAADEVRQVSDGEGFPPVTRGTMHGAQPLDVFVEVPPLEQRAVRVETSAPVVLTVEPDGSLTYRVVLWRQAKGVPDVVDLTVAAPEGWEVVGATLAGAGPTVALSGPDARRAPAELRVRRRSVSLSGALGADAEVRVRLRPLG